jgi:hypothetical protein
MGIKPQLILLTMLSCFSAASGQETSGLVLTKTLSLPKIQGGFNHMSVDASGERLFAAAPSDGTVEIVDLTSGRPPQSLACERPAAARYAPEFHELYVSRGESLAIYNARTLALVTSIDLHSRLDELAYDARAKELYVGCMSDGQTGIAVIAVPEGKMLAKIHLPGRPQGIAVELAGKRLFANVPSRGEVAVIDRARRAQLPSWPVRRARGNTPIALDEAHQRLFLGGRQPPRLLVMDTLTGKAVAEVPIDPFADDMAWDANRRRIYVSCDRFVDVVEQHDADHYRLLGRVATAPDAATSTFSPELDSLFVGAPPSDNAPAEILVFKAGK